MRITAALSLCSAESFVGAKFDRELEHFERSCWILDSGIECVGGGIGG